jgi:hypothetical protein
MKRTDPGFNVRARERDPPPGAARRAGENSEAICLREDWYIGQSLEHRPVTG